MANILYAEDDAGARRSVVRNLTDNGHTVTAAGSAEEALKCLRGGVFDVILSDVDMLEMTGVQLVQASEAAAVPIRILHSGKVTAMGQDKSGVWVIPKIGAHKSPIERATPCFELVRMIIRGEDVSEYIHSDNRDLL